MESSWKTTARTIVLSVLIGGGAGVVATAITSSYLADYAFQLEAWTAPLRLTEERPRAFPKTYEEALERVDQRAVPGFVQLFGAESALNGFVPAEALVSGAVMTSDGWIVVEAVGGLNLAALTAVVGGDAYAVTEVVPDATTGFAFVKLDAEHLPVAAFGSGFNLAAAEQVFVLPSAGEIIATSVANPDWRAGAVLSSDEPTRRIVLDEYMGGLWLGAPVVNLSGELVAFVDARSEEDGRVRALPIDALLPALESLLRDGKVVRPALETDVLDLARAAGVADDVSLGHNIGAVVVSSRMKELQKGDVILEVDGEFIRSDRTLDEMIGDRHPGDAILLAIDRAGTRTNVEVTLGEGK